MNHSEIVSFIWGVADLIRDYFRRGHYQDVILPFTILRRVDCVLAPTKQEVLATNNKYKGKLENPIPLLKDASGYSFYNTSQYDFQKLIGDHANIAANLRNYIAGFSPNMQQVFERFNFENTIKELEKSGLLFKVVERFNTVKLDPSSVPNSEMGTIFEELIRKFNEALDENPGEHFTPRDVVHLMVELLLAGEDTEELKRKGIVRTVYDPCCGTGGMLTITKEHILGSENNNGIKNIHLYGQEVNPETWAVSKSDMLMLDPQGTDADNIEFGSTLSHDAYKGRTFDYLIANPPYGKEWKQDEEEVKDEAARGSAGRFSAGLPRISDGQLLFLQTMIAKMKPASEGGSRIAIIMNGSPLFTGDAGSGESEIRRWILENDWLEALIALPEQLFYNTGIATYIWVLTNRKKEARKGRVLLINAIDFWISMRKSLGNKRREISEEMRESLLKLLEDYAETELCKIYPTTFFGYRRITVERPLRLNFQASPERIEHIEEETTFQNLIKSRKKNEEEKAKEESEGREIQERIKQLLTKLPDILFMSRPSFEVALRKAEFDNRLSLTAPLRKAILSALSVRDEKAEICRDSKGNLEPDTELRDYENVPLGEDINKYFALEVLPHVPDAWIDTAKRDKKDGQIGIVGYEINFNRYFYKYIPPRPLEEIERDIKNIEDEIDKLLKESTEL